MIRHLAMTTLLVLTLTACHASVDGARVHGDGYSVEVDGDRHHRGGKHCPPGHHMKGWC